MCARSRNHEALIVESICFYSIDPCSRLNQDYNLER